MVAILSDTVNQARAGLARKIEPGVVGSKLRRAAALAKLPKLKAGDTVVLLSLPMDSYLHSLKIAADNLGKTGTCDLGVNINGVTTADIFINGVILNTKALPLTELRFGKLPIDSVNTKNWQLTGAVTRPEGNSIDIVATITQDLDVAGNMIAIAEYAVE